MVSKEMALKLKKWIENRKYLEKCVQDFLIISQSIASDFVDAEKNSEGKEM